ncbi:6076_t:CDS:2 [Acaulospora morrowiae]|uniref:6076_t:CDS:1 n=1 Tax=Acaulospora morrowiae TaxID=94023 RepID=A0A9N9BI43_9GLOM|nr:6076_t:CDS:2 [Acaulospora morrowiae]
MWSKAIGIDLGTTNSCAGIWKNGKVEIIPNDHGNRTTPSYVAFSRAGRAIGENARNQIFMNPSNTIYNIKRLIGRQFMDPEVQSDVKYWPFQVINKNGRPYIQVEYRGKIKQLSPVEILSMLLCKIKESAEIFLEESVRNVVIAGGPYFNYSQRQAIKEAAMIARLNVHQIFTGSEAAAVAYNFYNRVSKERNILVFDFGGGTLDISILAVEEGLLEVKATASNAHLGGEDFDKRIVNHFVFEFKRKFKKDLTTDKRALCRLRTACERAKCALSSHTQAFIEIDYLFEEIDFYTSLTRDKFVEINMALFRRIIKPVERALRDAKIDKSHIHEVVLVGGSTHIPEVQKIISKFFNGKELDKSINPDEAIAYGAALYAASLSGDCSEQLQDTLLIRVLPRSLCVEIGDGVMKSIIKRNSSIPKRKYKILSTDSDNASYLVLKVYEGERTRTKDNGLIYEFQLTGIPCAPRGVSWIEVCYDVDSRGNLYVCVTVLVSAVDKTHGRANKITIVEDDRYDRLLKEEFEQMLLNAEEYNAEDKKIPEKERARNRFERYLDNLRETLQDAVTWFNDNQDAESEEYECKREDTIKKISCEAEEFDD